MIVQSYKRNTMKANIGLTDKNAQAVAKILNTLLADEHIVYLKTRNYHWNYIGDNLMEMHLFYESMYTELATIIDETAERVRMIGHYSEARLKDFLKVTRLDEPEYTTQQDEQVNNLLFDHETIIKALRKDIEKVDNTYKDAGTTDFLTGVMKQHEKMAWFLRSYIPE